MCRPVYTFKSSPLTIQYEILHVRYANSGADLYSRETVNRMRCAFFRPGISVVPAILFAA